MDKWVVVVGILAVSTGVVALLAWLYPKLRRERQGYPLEEQIEPLLLPVVYQAICAAYRVSEKAMDEIGASMRGLDKKAIAGAVYDMLPDEIGGRDVTFIKSMLTKERFEALVQGAFDRFDYFVNDQRVYQIEAFLAGIRGLEDFSMVFIS